MSWNDWFFIVFHSTLLASFVVILKNSYKKGKLKHFFYPTLFLKIFAGIGFGTLYFYYYQGGDTFTLYQDAYQFYKLFHQNKEAYFLAVFYNQFYNIPTLSRPEIWELSRAFFMLRLLSFFLIFTNGSYWLTSLYFSLISFSGMWFVANQLSTYFKKTEYAAVLAFLLFPSVVFWSSGIHKEAIAMASWGFLLGIFISYIKRKDITFYFYLKMLPLVIICIFFLGRLKFYYLGAFLPLAIAYIIIEKTFLKKYLTNFTFKSIALILVWALLLLLGSFSHYKLYPQNFLDVLVTNHNATFYFSEPDNVIYYLKFWGKGYFNLHSEVLYFLPNVPIGIVSGLFRPFLWEGRGILARASGLENLFTFSLMIWGILYFWKSFRKVKHKLLIFTGLIYVLFLATLLAMATPNFGTLVRYKIGFLPILIYISSIPLSYYLNKKEY